MVTYLIFGPMTWEVRKVVHTEHTTDALALITKYGGTFDTRAAA